MNVLIVGYGVVGHNLEKEIQKLNPEVFDKYKEVDTRTKDKYDIAFICVDTPINDKCLCDTTEVKKAIEEHKASIYVIKSTILPHSTEKLVEETGKHIVFSPEYYGATQHCNNFEFGFTVLGGEKSDCQKVIQVLQTVYDGRHTFRMVDSVTAELAKYMENSWLATKVSFCSQFYQIAKKHGVSYEELRELFILDPRVNPSHTFVYEEHPYWESHCLDKDVEAIAKSEDAELLLSIIDFNEKCKKK
ncbi:MAG: hypothetical protein J6W35_03095 [Eubacterium sp.]|nr:hypothetical protein [Eubacterium sp.]